MSKIPFAPAARATAGIDRLPWMFLSIAIGALIVQFNPEWRDSLLYVRGTIATGEGWRLWTAHLVHFGWPHFIADTGLFIFLGWLLERREPRLSRLALVVMPLVISGGLYFASPEMTRYGGLSAVNLGLLVFVACEGWRKNWVDWFWPSILAIYIGEVVFETVRQNGRGGGMIPFDDSSVRVATAAHVAAGLCGFFLWCLAQRARVVASWNEGPALLSPSAGLLRSDNSAPHRSQEKV